MKKLLLICWFLCGVFFVAQAQDFKYYGTIQAGAESRFYKIMLAPEVVSKAQADLADIRLKDWKNREVPYILERAAALERHQYFQEYPVVEKVSNKGVNTTLVVRNQNRNKINNLGLLIKNTNVIKKASLSGSPDGENWYALENNFVLQNVASALETSEVKILNFPLSDYEYYRLEINDSASAPLNILAAGYYDFRAEAGEFTEINNFHHSQIDSAEKKQTYLSFSFPEPVLIDKLVFEIDSTTFFRRNATVFEKQTYTGKRGRQSVEYVSVHSFQLESNSSNTVALNGFRSSDFLIVIDNGDNPPLHVKKAQAFQLKTYLIAELKGSKNYTLQVGNEKALKPAYDLEYFKDKIPEGLPILTVQNVTSAPKITSQTSGVNGFFRNKIIIWIAIIGVIALLAFMTWQMLHEAGKKPGK